MSVRPEISTMEEEPPPAAGAGPGGPEGSGGMYDKTSADYYFDSYVRGPRSPPARPLAAPLSPPPC